MRDKIIFTLSILGIVAALIAAYGFGIERKAQPPAFAPVSNPYATAIFANGIIESDQLGGSNITIYPDVPARSQRYWCARGKKLKQVRLFCPLMIPCRKRLLSNCAFKPKLLRRY